MYKKVFDPKKDDGVYYFVSGKPFNKNKKQRGFGKIGYPEGSVYEGDILYDGSSFGKMGFGEQDFTNSILDPMGFGAPNDLKLYKYIGQFDCIKCDWMYGNGIVYFTDKDGNPKAFIKGYFNRTKKVAEWKGKFNGKLLSGFTPDMEIQQLPVITFSDKATAYKQRFTDTPCDFLVFGDSWTDFWQDELKKDGGTFYSDMEKYAKGVKAINVGIGGTKYCDWFDFIYDIVIPHRPKTVFVHLGGNDIAAKFSVKKVFNDFIKIAKRLKKALPDTKIYFSAVCPIIDFDSLDAEEELNALTEQYCKENGLYYIPTDLVFKKDGKVIENIDDYFVEDKIHLNLKGYALWSEFVLKSIFKK